MDDGDRTLEALGGLTSEDLASLAAERIEVSVFNGGPVNAKRLIAMCLTSVDEPSLVEEVSVVLEQSDGSGPGSRLRLVRGPLPEIIQLSRAEVHTRGSAMIFCFAGYAV